MSRIEDSIRVEKDSRGYAFIPYLMSGFPSEEDFIKAGRLLSKYSSVMEIGIPYSDPVADGPTIQLAHNAVLMKKLKLRELIALSSEIKAEKVIMTYYSPIHRTGIDKFVSLINEYGITGLLVPDLPVELAGELVSKCREYKIDNIFLVSPNTREERMRLVSLNSNGFIYVVQRYGVTGESKEVYGPIKEVIVKLRSITNKPIGVGFGVSRGEHIKQLVEMGADAIIVGSHIINTIKNGVDEKKLDEEIKDLLIKLKDKLS